MNSVRISTAGARKRVTAVWQAIEERDSGALPYDVFVRDYLTQGRPLIIRNATPEWPALKKWTPQFFKERFGPKMVQVSYDEQMSFSDFIDGVMASTEDKPGPYMYRLFLHQHPELAHLYDDRIGKAFPSDYPVLFWLARLLPELTSVFDWGGHIGVSYYTYQKYLDLPERLEWRVGDVHHIIEAGRALAASRSATALTFTTELSDADGFDLLFANGSLQFVELPFSVSVERLARRPRHIIVNKLPAYAGETFVTLENTIHSFNPYRVVNREAFVESLTALGYSLVESWDNPDMKCRIPLHRERSLDSYSGFYFRPTP